MVQPIKKSGTFQKPRSKTKSRKVAAISDSSDKRIPVKNKQQKKKRAHAKYGTSKLEERFARDFLDKLGIEYVYQFEAKSIKRFFDFYIPDCNVLIEIDGDFFHSYGLVYEQMSPMQKKNKRVDEQKDHWALINGYKLIRIWEHDINKHQESVIEMLKTELESGMKKKIIKESKSKRNLNANKNIDTGN